LRLRVGTATAIDVPIADAERVWSDAVPRYFAKRVA
jgi:hypothetical protein